MHRYGSPFRLNRSHVALHSGDARKSAGTPTDADRALNSACVIGTKSWVQPRAGFAAATGDATAATMAALLRR